VALSERNESKGRVRGDLAISVIRIEDGAGSVVRLVKMSRAISVDNARSPREPRRIVKTRKLAKWYGDRLVCVRYRHDETRRRRIKAVELIERRRERV
jgi:hypothetical protein